MRTRDPRPFDEDDLLLAEELVRRAAISVDRARRYAREHSAALALQRASSAARTPRDGTRPCAGSAAP
ncbi:hypothetical protein [Actinacidiphila glaucinigra]|uniref:hypothetical protein n=1 Tax=Actinacidiphila glaucinigra TaxID=235986 RepID=UPI003D93768C